MRAFWIALQFLTRLPTPRIESDPATAGRSVLYYPLVGLVIGAPLAALGWLLAGQDALVTAALVLLLWVLLTGALHLDGLADSADAWLGSHGEGEGGGAIMKDPACGPTGVVAVTVVLIAKFAALTALVGTHDWLVILLAPALARSAILALFLSTRYVRPQGIGEAFARSLPRHAAVVVLLVVAAGVAAVLHWRGLALLVVVAAGFWWLRRLMLKRLGGTTGDTAGALIELLELLVLACATLISDDGITERGYGLLFLKRS